MASWKENLICNLGTWIGVPAPELSRSVTLGELCPLVSLRLGFLVLLSTHHVVGKICSVLSHHSSVRSALLTQFHNGSLITLLKLYKLSIWHEIPIRICLVPKSVYILPLYNHYPPWTNFLSKIRQWNTMVRSRDLESDSSLFIFELCIQPFIMSDLE